ncbi:MAG TPA: VPLPA-CTERM sorting domain-containing protein [Terriglobales bacterium]|nr:VPLPA-CTERM sorting domain-containing protein [Terriglobales bacterium]
MKKGLLLIAFALLLTGVATTTAWADDWYLWDWSVNINDTTYNPPALPGTVNSATFDFNTGLGSMTITFSSPGANYGGIYLYPFWNIDQSPGDFSNAYGTVNGVPPAGLSYSLGWPGVDYGAGSVFDMFALDTLDNTNHVPAYAPPPDACCSVAMGENFAFILSPGETGLLTFSTSTTPPPGGFFLQLTDNDNGENYYLTESFTIKSSTEVPEPASALLLVSGLGAMLGLRRKSAVK